MNRKGSTESTISIIFLLLFGFFFLVTMSAYTMKIPGVAGKLLGFVNAGLVAVTDTIWSMIGEFVGPVLNNIADAFRFSFYTSAAFAGVIATKYVVLGALKLMPASFRQIATIGGTRGLLRSIFSRDFGRVLLIGIKRLPSRIGSYVSKHGWTGALKYGVKGLATGIRGFLKGAAVGFIIELAVTFGLDALSMHLTGLPFAQTIDNAVGGPAHFGTPFGEATFSLGSATQGAISGAAGGAAMGAILAPFTLGVSIAVGAGIGALVGFITGGFFG